MFIVKNDSLLYQLNLISTSNIIDEWTLYSNFLKTSKSWNHRKDSDEISSEKIENIRLFFKYLSKYDLNIIISVDLFNNIDRILSFFKEILTILENRSEKAFQQIDQYEIYNKMFFALQKNLPIKISVVGFGGVGKTTALKLLKEEKLPTEHNPTILTDITQYNLNGIYLNFWDFAGQVAYKKIWHKFIIKSDLVIVITDSTQKNVSLSKFFLDLIKNVVPYSKKFILANKQDLQNALEVSRINRILGENSIPFVAIDPKNRNILINLIFNSLGLITENEQVIIQSNS